MTKALQKAKKPALWKDEKQLAEIKNIYGKDLSVGEFQVFLQIGMATGLNPFLKEIWAVKYGNAPAQIFIGRDGYRKVAQQHPEYDFHLVDAVYEKDTFDVANAEVSHSYDLKERGALIGAYCLVKRKNSSKGVFNFVEFKEYYQGNKDEDGKVKQRYDKYKKEYQPMKPTLWDSKPATMIKKVAEAQTLRMAFQEVFAGTYDESEQWEKETIHPKGTATVMPNKDAKSTPPPQPNPDVIKVNEDDPRWADDAKNMRELNALLKQFGMPRDAFKKAYKVESTKDLTKKQIVASIVMIRKKLDAGEMWTDPNLKTVDAEEAPEAKKK